MKGIAPVTSLGDKIDSVVTLIYEQSSTYPKAGDYINFRSVDGTGLIADQSNYASAPGGDSLRPAKESNQQWNTALNYDTETHLPAPWVLISEGVVESKDKDENKEDDNKDKDKDGKEKVYADPTFRVVMTAPFEFAIVMDETLPERARTYSVMDMKGQVVSTGVLDSKDTRVKMQTTGSYVVKVGLGSRRVNVK